MQGALRLSAGLRSAALPLLVSYDLVGVARQADWEGPCPPTCTTSWPLGHSVCRVDSARCGGCATHGKRKARVTAPIRLSAAPMAPPSFTCRFVCPSALVRLTEAGTVIRIKSPAPGPRPSRRWGHPLYIRPASPFTPMETQDPDDPERWLLQSSSGRRCKVLTKPATWVCGCVCKGLCAAPRSGLAAASPACGPHVRGELWGLRKQHHVQ